MQYSNLIMTKRYTIPYELFVRGFSAFQKKYVYPRCIVTSLIMVALAAANVVNICVGNGSTAGMVLVFICLALAAVNIYNPKKIKRNLLEAVKGIEGDVYSIKIYKDRFKIGTVIDTEPEHEKGDEVFEGLGEKDENSDDGNIDETEIFINNKIRVVDRDDFYLLYLKGSMFYVIPKSIFDKEEIDILNVHFRKNLMKNYISDFDSV